MRNVGGGVQEGEEAKGAGREKTLIRDGKLDLEERRETARKINI